MTDETPVTPPETVVKKARVRATKAINEGVADARNAATEALPALAETVSKAVYGTCYHAAYYATFTVLTLARLVPADSPVAQGLHDGAEAAGDDFKAHKEQQARMAAAKVGTTGDGG